MENKSIVLVGGDSGIFEIIVYDGAGGYSGIPLPDRADVRGAMEFSAGALALNPAVLYPFEQITSLDPLNMLEQFKDTMYRRLRDKKSTRPGLLEHNGVVLACDGVTDVEPESYNPMWFSIMVSAVNMGLPRDGFHKCFYCHSNKPTHICVHCKERIWCGSACRSAGSQYHKKFCGEGYPGNLIQAMIKCDCCSFPVDGSLMLSLFQENHLPKISIVAMTLYAFVMASGRDPFAGNSCPRVYHMRHLLNFVCCYHAADDLVSLIGDCVG